MPGGELKISFSEDFRATMTGPVTKVCEGVMSREMFQRKSKRAPLTGREKASIKI